MPQVVSIDEEKKKHVDEWLLFEVTEADVSRGPVKGRLLCHDKSRKKVHKAAMQVREKETFVFFTGDPVPPGVIPTSASTTTWRRRSLRSGGIRGLAAIRRAQSRSEPGTLQT